MSVRVEALRAKTVLDLEGKVVPVATVLDAERTTVLAFIRHFG